MVFITGASSGIGAATARGFARKGKALFLAARRIDRLEKMAAEFKRELAVEVHAAELDVRDTAAIEAFARLHEGLLARTTILVNSAGLAKGLDPLQTGKPDDWDAMFDTNVKGLLHVTRAVLPHFLEKNEGHIVNLGSVAGRWVYPKGNVYCASKHAVHALSQALRIDLAGTRIRVTEISPGMVETEFSVVRLGDEKKAKDVYAGMKPLTGEDIAEAILWSTGLPPHVNIQEIVLFPTDQATPSTVTRRGT